MRSSKCLITFIALGLFSAGTVFGSGLVFGAGSIHFPNKVAQAGEFRVSGPDHFQYKSSFEAGESLSFSLYGADGFALPDGLYKWSIEARGNAEGGERGLSPRVEPVTGTFSIRDGAFVNPNLVEAVPNKDQVINDDLIVTSSICVGQDCVNGESFGFDTLRLKENNLRIKAQDTSNSASFPTVDWQLTFNESSNGGLNKFSVDSIDNSRTPFTIEFGAGTDALYVEADGDIGMGTKDPVVELHIKGGDTPTLRLEQDGTSGFTPQTFDIASNEANFFIRDVTNGSKLVMKIKPGAPTSSIFVAADGDIGLGSESPGAGLHVLEGGSSFTGFAGTAAIFQNNAAATDFVAISMIAGADSNAQLTFGDLTNQTNGRIVYENNTDNMDVRATNNVILEPDGTGDLLVISADGNMISNVNNGAVLNASGVWLDASSRELKENIVPMNAKEALQAFSELEPVTYNYKVEPGELTAGFIAEDVPDLVATNSRKNLGALDLIAVLTKVTQEQQKTIELLLDRVAELENE